MTNPYKAPHAKRDTSYDGCGCALLITAVVVWSACCVLLGAAVVTTVFF